MPKFGLELHKKGESVFVGTGTSNPEGQKHIGKRVISCNSSGESCGEIMYAFENIEKTLGRITIILEGGNTVDIRPQGVLLRLKNWFNGVSKGRRHDNHRPLPALDDPIFRPTMGVNPKTGKIQFGTAIRSSALQRIFDR